MSKKLLLLAKIKKQAVKYVARILHPVLILAVFERCKLSGVASKHRTVAGNLPFANLLSDVVF